MKERITSFLSIILGIGIISSPFIWRYYNPIIHDAVAEEITEEKRTAKKLESDLQYEEKFYEYEQKNISTGKYPPTIIRVRAPNGDIVTGQWLFIPECPKGFWCAQPDGSLGDEHDTGRDYPEPEPYEPSR